MGMTKAPTTCYLTDINTENSPSTNDSIEYIITLNGRNHFFRFLNNHKNSNYIESNKHILKGLIINGKFPKIKDYEYFTNDSLEQLINEAQPPTTPKEKFDNLLIFLFENQSHDGEFINLSNFGTGDLLAWRLYFKNYKEYWFYLNTLRKEGLIEFRDSSTLEGKSAFNLQMTFQGLQYIIELQENGKQSKNCFIAMSFSESALRIRDIIKNAVVSTGYSPLLIDEVHYESDITINDAIIRYIKKSKFVIADFTDQKHGVYFEAGFALGLRKQVIYTCLKSDFDKTHFDTNHYPHIVYENLTELEEKLKDKILAWI